MSDPRCKRCSGKPMVERGRNDRFRVRCNCGRVGPEGIFPEEAIRLWDMIPQSGALPAGTAPVGVPILVQSIDSPDVWSLLRCSSGPKWAYSGWAPFQGAVCPVCGGLIFVNDQIVQSPDSGKMWCSGECYCQSQTRRLFEESDWKFMYEGAIP